MKYAIVIPDGCADDPQESLGGKTPLQAAATPNMDRVASAGLVGRSNNVPSSLVPASDVATLSLFGYDPLVVYTGRAPLEAAAMGIKLGPNDWAVRCNLVTIENEEMRDFTAGHISPEDGRRLIESIGEKLGGTCEGTSAKLEFHPGVSYRNILVVRTDEPIFAADTNTQAPHDIPDKPIEGFLPSGLGSEILKSLMEKSRAILADHPVNRARGDKAATQVWLWGQGKAPKLTPFAEAYGKNGAIISAVDLVRGVGTLLGWKRIDVKGATGYLDTDYAAKGRAGVEALGEHDLVCVHVEAPDEASHEGLPDEKVKALEQIDRHIVAPLLEALPKHGDWRILVSPDHRTTLKTRAHAYGAVPFAICGTGIETDGSQNYDEPTAAASGQSFEQGFRLMSWFLGQ